MPFILHGSWSHDFRRKLVPYAAKFGYFRRIAVYLRNKFLGDPKNRPQICYGQDGEDLILDRLLDGQKSGFFVDVGAHHPVRFSNTYLFYRRGWRGINIDAQPQSMNAFRRLRERDINIEVGVGSRAGWERYFRFNEPALNTFEPEEAKRKAVGPYRIEEEVDVQVRRLDDILDHHVPADTAIDFLSVDVEGLDLDVLQSNDWQRFRPRFVLAETLRTPLAELHNCPVTAFLIAQGYTPVSKAYNTTFFELAG